MENTQNIPDEIVYPEYQDIINNCMEVSDYRKKVFKLLEKYRELNLKVGLSRKDRYTYKRDFRNKFFGEILPIACLFKHLETKGHITIYDNRRQVDASLILPDKTIINIECTEIKDGQNDKLCMQNLKENKSRKIIETPKEETKYKPIDFTSIINKITKTNSEYKNGWLLTVVYCSYTCKQLLDGRSGFVQNMQKKDKKQNPFNNIYLLYKPSPKECDIYDLFSSGSWHS